MIAASSRLSTEHVSDSSVEEITYWSVFVIPASNRLSTERVSDSSVEQITY